MVIFSLRSSFYTNRGGGALSLLGSRLRIRRRQIRLNQREVAGESSASFLSKVENGVALPSLNSLQEWSQVLNATSGDLLGDHLVLEAAKQTVLITDKCLSYLDLLPCTKTTSFLRQLTSSANSLSMPVPAPPSDPELQYLTALTLMKRHLFAEAKELVLAVLATTQVSLWRIYHLSLLCQIYGELSEPSKQSEAERELKKILADLDYDKLLQTLPDGESLTVDDLKLLEFAFFKFS